MSHKCGTFLLNLSKILNGKSMSSSLAIAKICNTALLEPPKAASQYAWPQGYVDPLSFFSTSGERIWERCSRLAGTLRAKRGRDDMEYLKKSISLRVRSNETGTEYILVQHMKPVGSGAPPNGFFRRRPVSMSWPATFVSKGNRRRPSGISSAR